jgi:hypothetical protein
MISLLALLIRKMPSAAPLQDVFLESLASNIELVMKSGNWYYITHTSTEKIQGVSYCLFTLENVQTDNPAQYLTFASKHTQSQMIMIPELCFPNTSLTPRCLYVLYRRQLPYTCQYEVIFSKRITDPEDIFVKDPRPPVHQHFYVDSDYPLYRKK